MGPRIFYGISCILRYGGVHLLRTWCAPKFLWHMRIFENIWVCEFSALARPIRAGKMGPKLLLGHDDFEFNLNWNQINFYKFIYLINNRAPLRVLCLPLPSLEGYMLPFTCCSAGCSRMHSLRPSVPLDPHRGLRLRYIRGTSHLHIDPCSCRCRVGLSDWR